LAGPYYPPDWDKIRLRQLEHDNYTCKGCGNTREQLEQYGLGHLEVHHVNSGAPEYFHLGGKEEVGKNLITFCRRCHEHITESVHEQANLLAKRKKVTISVTETQSSITPEGRAHRPIEITVSDQQDQTVHISSARKVEIRLFND